MNATNATRPASNATSPLPSAASDATGPAFTWLFLVYVIDNSIYRQFTATSWATLLYTMYFAAAFALYVGSHMAEVLLRRWEWRMCPQCRRRFPDRGTMLQHLRHAHPEEAPTHLKALGVRFTDTDSEAGDGEGSSGGGGGGSGGDGADSDEATVASARSTARGGAMAVASSKAEAWQQCFDQEAGSAYWYNTRTGESTWAEPDELKASSSSGTAKVHERLSRFLKRLRLDAYFVKLRELGASTAGDLLELDATMLDDIGMKPLEAARFRKELRLLRVGTQPLDLSRVRDWQQREAARRLGHADGRQKRPATVALHI